MAESKEPKFKPVDLVGMLALIPIAVYLRGFVIVKLWSMFAVPLGVPAIGIAHAIGIAILASVVVARKSKARDLKGMSRGEVWGEVIGHAVLGPLLIWGMGGVAHLFMVGG